MQSFATSAVLVALSVAGLAVAQPKDAPPPAPGVIAAPVVNRQRTETDWRAGRNTALLALLDEHVDWTLKNDPLDASRRGDLRFNDQLADISPQAISSRLAEAQDRLRRLNALESVGFTEDDRLDADLLRLELEQTLEAAKFHREQLPIDSRSGPQIWLPQMGDTLPLSTPKLRADYTARLQRVPVFIDQTIDQMRAGLAAGRVPPRVVMLGTVEQCRHLASADIRQTPSLSPFFAPLRSLPQTDEAARQARAAISDGIVPAYARLAEFLEREYIPSCRDTFGASDGVDGRALYDFALREHTTTDLTAEQVHQLGLAEVARIRAEMFQVIARTDFPQRDSLHADELFTAFIQYLRTNPRFYYTTPEALLTGYRDIAKRIDAQLPRLFGTLPRLPYGVREMPAFSAPASPTAYYYPGSLSAGVAGFFIANTYRLDQRPRYEMIALTLHEAVPGHHLQIALAQELVGQHPYRTFSGFTAFVEGWALYAERLGMEVGGEDRPADPGSGPGLYADPYDDFGRLTYEMWRACRLVVDTGIHAKGWTRTQAIDFMKANTALAPHNIEREVDRYIAWPGQACAYKLGELKIRQLRARAEKALGPRFDRRTFHDAVLDTGALPLPTLEAKIDRWIAAQISAGPAPGQAP